MCLRPVKINAISPNAPRVCYVPCGNCKDCRNAYKSQWQIRLTTELVQRQKEGWYVGFVTLTYDDAHLPHVPSDLLFSDVSGPVPCFNRNHIRKFIVDIRRDLDEFYKVHGLVYMICGEYGSYTRRPHYHCIFSWPSSVRPVDFWALLNKYWSYGFLIPKDLNGGYDSEGRYHKPFLVSGSARFAGIYASKYTCKDLDFAQDIRDKVDTKNKLWKQYNCFHVQSRSLGLSWLNSKSSSELRDIFLNGVSFVGDSFRHQIPVYFRNKILFSPYYVLERKVYKGIKLQDSTDLFMSASDSELESQGYRVEYKRLVRRKCTEFFYENRRLVFDKRVQFWKDALLAICSPDYLMSKSKCFADDPAFAQRCSAEASCLVNRFGLDCVSSWIVARHGVPYEKQYNCSDIDLWFSRYDLSYSDFTSCDLIDNLFFGSITIHIDFVLSVFGLIYSSDSEHDLYIKRLQDKLKSEVI